MDNLLALGKRLLDAARNLLTGEPARVIGYGAAVVVYLVANALGAIPDMTFDAAIASAVAAIALIGGVIESIRKFVYSPNTVEAILAGAEDLT